MVSKILWPGLKINDVDRERVGEENIPTLKAIRKQRGPALERALNVSDLPLRLLQNTKLRNRLRNDFEHFDERIESWFVSSPQRNFVDMSIFWPGSVSGFDLADYQRVLDPTTMVVSFQGEDFDLSALAADMARIQGAITQWRAAHPFPEPVREPTPRTVEN
jgi:hypothetical protein